MANRAGVIAFQYPKDRVPQGRILPLAPEAKTATPARAAAGTGSRPQRRRHDHYHDGTNRT